MPYLEDASLASGFLDFPSKIQIQTVNRCNYLCPMCPYPEVTATEPRVQLDGDLYRRLIGEVREAGRRVKLCLMLQNEPLLDRRFLDFLDEAHRADDCIASISTVTNGSVLTEGLLDALLAYERFYLTVSVNATDRERYARIHGRDLWERVHGLLASWQGARHRIRLSFVVDGAAVEEGRTFRRYWHALGYGVRFIPLFARIDLMSVEDPVHAFDESYGHCHYPIDTLNVLAGGEVVLCCMDWLHQERFGNLHHASIAEIWRSPALASIRTAALEGRLREGGMCRTCDYPIRSSQRMLLEARLADGPEDCQTAPLPFSAHATHLRSEQGRTTPILVCSADEASGSLLAFCSGSPPSGRVWVNLCIGQKGAFNFGSLEPVWCPATLTPVQADLGVDGAVPIRIQLDAQTDEFRFFRWYCADWSLGVPTDPAILLDPWVVVNTTTEGGEKDA